MSDDRMEELIIDISQKLSSISTSMSIVLNQLADHNNRLTQLEKLPQNQTRFNKDDDFKSEMLKLLGKCLLIGITVIASLAGAGGLLQKIFGA